MFLGVGFRIQGLGFRVYGLGSGSRMGFPGLGSGSGASRATAARIRFFFLSNFAVGLVICSLIPSCSSLFSVVLKLVLFGCSLSF